MDAWELLLEAKIVFIRKFLITGTASQVRISYRLHQLKNHQISQAGPEFRLILFNLVFSSSFLQIITHSLIITPKMDFLLKQSVLLHMRTFIAGCWLDKSHRVTFATQKWLFLCFSSLQWQDSQFKAFHFHFQQWRTNFDLCDVRITIYKLKNTFKLT